VDLESKPMASIGFARNDQWLGIAMQFGAGEKGLGLVGAAVRPAQWESALFPHVLLKNVVVEMQFSREDGLEPVDGYEPWASAFADGNAVFGPVFEQSECEVMMMVGLPASGKSTWAEKWVKEHPEKRFILLGTNLILEQMKVGLPLVALVIFCCVVLPFEFVTALIHCRFQDCCRRITMVSASID
jgi:heterogeneous nuclear ribonucleoprotein U-like protein 1